MSNCILVATTFETVAKLRKDTNDELVNATFYKKIIGSLRYVCNTRQIFV